jgi:hypothetical protein
MSSIAGIAGNASSVSGQQSRINGELQKATHQLRIGLTELLGRFDTRAGEQLFRSFTSALTLFGAEAGARFMTENAGSIRSLSSSQQAAFSSVLSDAKDVAFLRQEATRLANLPSLEALLSRIELK